MNWTDRRMSLLKRLVAKYKASLDEIAADLFRHPEIAGKEHYACERLQNFLAAHGFSIQKDIVRELPTAFCATWGEDGPQIGFLAEYDALPERYQLPDTWEKSSGNGPGHACGHNLIAAACAVAAVMAKEAAEEEKIALTLHVFGCPSEENMRGKTTMAEAGVFSGLNAAIAWHPEDFNGAVAYRCNAISIVEYHFEGKASHAAAAPQDGRSALDACELMNIGTNYLREHVVDGCRFHYAYLNAPSVPNVVPEKAALLYQIRGRNIQIVRDLRERLRCVAEGASLMTGTTVVVKEMLTVPETLPNMALTSLANQVMREVPLVKVGTEERLFARNLLENVGSKSRDILKEEVRPFDGKIEQRMGSSDVAAVSWLVPTVMLRNTCVPFGIPQHHWAFAASCGSVVGRTGAYNGAQIMAAFALCLSEKPEILQRASEELQNSRIEQEETNDA